MDLGNIIAIYILEALKGKLQYTQIMALHIQSSH